MHEVKERQTALGHALFLKMVKIHSHLHALEMHFKDSFAMAEREGFRGEAWQIVRPPANAPEKVNFTIDELAMLLALNDNDLFNGIVSIDEIHNSVIDVFNTFSQRRLALTEMLSAEMDGIVGRTELTRDQMIFIRPRMVELNDLIGSLRQTCERDTQDAWRSLVGLQRFSEKRSTWHIRLS